jgi:hypothetical protein
MADWLRSAIFSSSAQEPDPAAHLPWQSSKDTLGPPGEALLGSLEDNQDDELLRVGLP